MKEAIFQAQLIKKIKERFPGCVVLKNDPNYIQGIPDLILLYHDRWAALECKQRYNSPLRPNQKYYVQLMNEMSFARFISPDNEEDVLSDLQSAFEV